MRSIFILVLLFISFLPSALVAQTPDLWAHQQPYSQSCLGTDGCPCQDCQIASDCGFGTICDAPDCHSRNWIDIDFLYLNYDGFRVPNLVAESNPGTPRSQVGILGDPATRMVLGNQRVGDDWRSGLNINLGRYLDDCGTYAITGSVFGLANSENTQNYPTSPDQIISRPFYNLDPGVNGWDAELVNYPGIVSGSMSISTSSEIFSGNIGLQKKLCCCTDPCFDRATRLDFYIGYRAFSLEEQLVISETLNPIGGFIVPGSAIDLIDRFEAQNRFHGIEFGLMKNWQRRRWTLETMGKVALGNVQQRVQIDGSTTVSIPGTSPAVYPYGLLATPSNIGTYERDQFGVLTQAQLELGYRVSRRLKVKLGYNLLYLNKVARPGDQIDPFVNATQIDPNVVTQGANRPHFNWRSDSVLLHGLNAGFEFRF